MQILISAINSCCAALLPSTCCIKILVPQYDAKCVTINMRFNAIKKSVGTRPNLSHCIVCIASAK